MRLGRVSTIAIIGVVALLSLAAVPRAAAEDLTVTPRATPAGAVPGKTGSGKLPPTSSRQARSRQSEEAKPVQLAFVDEETPWILPPPDPPPELTDIIGVLQCVPYARFMSGIGLRGDAWTWWDQAAGIYARGNHPEPGAILSFPGIDRMPLGHLAVVRQVLSGRKILIEHAN
jgi:hypothetical protein